MHKMPVQLDEYNFNIVRQELEELIQLNKSIIALFTGKDDDSIDLIAQDDDDQLECGSGSAVNTLTCEEIENGDSNSLYSYEPHKRNDESPPKKTDDIKIIHKNKIKVKKIPPSKSAGSRRKRKQARPDAQGDNDQEEIVHLRAQNAYLMEQANVLQEFQEQKEREAEVKRRCLEKYEQKLEVLFKELMDASKVMQESRNKLCECLKKTAQTGATSADLHQKYEQLKGRFVQQESALARIRDKYDSIKLKEEKSNFEQKNLRRLIRELATVIKENQKTMQAQQKSIQTLKDRERGANAPLLDKGKCVCQLQTAHTPRQSSLDVDDYFSPTLSEELEDLIKDVHVEINNSVNKQKIIVEQSKTIEALKQSLTYQQKQCEHLQQEIKRTQKQLEKVQKDKINAMQNFQTVQQQNKELEIQIRNICQCGH